MAERERKYWLHRISGGENALTVALPLLQEENILSIGWSVFSENAFAEDVLQRGIVAINEGYEKVGKETSSNRWSLLRFIKGMQKGDYVVVPRPGTFRIYEIADDIIMTNEDYSEINFQEENGYIPEKKGKYLYNEEGEVIDLGFYRRVNPVVKDVLYRGTHATPALRSRMKIYQTNADISDLWSDIETIINNQNNQQPVDAEEKGTHVKEDSLAKITHLCESLRNVSGELNLTNKELSIIAQDIKETFSQNEGGVSHLQQAGLMDLRFLDTCLSQMAGFVFPDGASSYATTKQAPLLGLTIKYIKDSSINLSPLFEDKKLIEQSRSINFIEWYLEGKVLSQGEETFTRSDIIERFITKTPIDEETKTDCFYNLEKSGIFHNNQELPFADDPIDISFKQILYEVIESFRIEGILNVSSVDELAQHVEKSQELFVKSLWVKNYKLFGKAKQIEFRDKFSVIIGNNATGKTTALSAIRLLLDSMLPVPRNETNKNSSYGYYGSISQQDVHRDISEDGGLEYYFPVTIEADFSDFGKISRARMEENHKTQNKKRVLNDYFRSVDNDITGSTRLPLISYCGVERTRSIETTRSRNKLHNNRYDGYNSCLETHCSSSYLRRWLNDLQKKAKRSARYNELLQSFKNAVCSCFDDEKIVNIEYVYWEIQSSKGKKDIIDDIIITKEDKEENKCRRLLRSMSAGYRAMIGLIADLAFRCICLNPQLGKDAIVGTKGIVLIDEIDMHLHPSWQRHIVSDLIRCFPKLQFIVTTHSPFIVQSLKKEQIINLAGEDVINDPLNESLATNAYYMGVDSDRSIIFKKQENMAYDILKAIKKRSSEEDIDKMLKQYALLNGTDPVYVAQLRLEDEIERIERKCKTEEKVLHEAC